MPLSPTTGPYDVSTLTLEIPLSSPRDFHADSYRSNPSSSHSAPAFRLQTVLLTLFYPIDGPKTSAGHHGLAKGTLPWLTTPRLKSIEGLLKYAGVSKYFALPAILPAYQVLLAKLPFYQNAPLAKAESPRKWPTALFSHGLGGTAVTYSSYLASLASQGVVVAAVEHRDGTCPATSIRTRAEDGKKVHEHSLLYFKDEEVKTPSAPGGKWDFRQAQLEFRRAELHELLRLVKELNSGQGEALTAASTRGGPELANADLSSWQGKLDVDDGLLLLGHSFGGATVLTDQLSTDAIEGPVDGSGTKIKAKLAILLDPWLEPLPIALDNTPASNTRTPFLTINSQGFTVWKPHFDRLKRLIASSTPTSAAKQDADRPSSTLLTLTGCKHTDFSDFPFLIPRLFASSVEPLRCLRIFSELSRRAIDDETIWDGQSVGTVKLSEGEDVNIRWETDSEAGGSKEMGEPGVLVQHRL
ncbi:hypothetical protein BCV69DRAFT_285172 [Microstroma glucosiphilum]|uniref:Putative phospholipase n=1 Tax=Pseudomicrostroma glucosiphilum TaxID=1684307 RepID=A0A316U109_9BASI|nr:hypothetical protein BCV69DRAFT_285172 [Pseudomicrostroma glucosiphilum]PWN18191.1 hypothetical protein BCV69DRAFT_285172 [Pseudomicrostroma glucosiphilum]